MEKPSGRDEEPTFRLLIFFLTVLVSKYQLLIWSPPDVSRQGGMYVVSSLENTEPNWLFRIVAIRVLSVTRSPACFKGPTETLELVFDLMYELKGRLFPFLAMLDSNSFLAFLWLFYTPFLWPYICQIHMWYPSACIYYNVFAYV